MWYTEPDIHQGTTLKYILPLALVLLPTVTLADDAPVHPPHVALSVVGGLPNLYGLALDLYPRPDMSIRVEAGTGILPPAVGLGLHFFPARLSHVSPEHGTVGLGWGVDVFTFVPKPHELLIPLSAELYARRQVGSALAVHGGLTAGAGLAVGGLEDESSAVRIEPGLLFRLFLGVSL